MSNDECLKNDEQDSGQLTVDSCQLLPPSAATATVHCQLTTDRFVIRHSFGLRRSSFLVLFPKVRATAARLSSSWVFLPDPEGESARGARDPQQTDPERACRRDPV